MFDRFRKEQEQKETEAPKWYRRSHFLYVCFILHLNSRNKGALFKDGILNSLVTLLISYMFLLVCVTNPILVTEIFLGQYSGLNPLQVWKMIPLAKGLGYTMLLSSLFRVFASQTTGTLALYYLIESFSDHLPWENCRFAGGVRETCCDFSRLKVTNPETYPANYTNKVLCRVLMSIQRNFSYEFPALHYMRSIINPARFNKPELGSLGTVVTMTILGSTVICWIILMFTLFMGVFRLRKWLPIGICMYFITFFVLMCLALGDTYGSDLGLRGLFNIGKQWPANFQYLSGMAELLIDDLRLGSGIFTLHSSFMEIKTDITIDATFVNAFLLGSNILFLLIISSLAGVLSNALNVRYAEFSKVRADEVIFAIIPNFLVVQSQPQLYSILYFGTLLFQYILEQTISLDVIVQSFIETNPKLRNSRKFIIPIIIALGIVTGIIIDLAENRHLYPLLPYYFCRFNVVGIIVLQSIVVYWLYGVNRFSLDLEFTLDEKVSKLKEIWMLLMPVVYMFLFTWSLRNIIQIVQLPNFPWRYLLWWTIGTTITYSPAIIYAIYFVSKSVINRDVRPSILIPEDWGPKDPEKLKQRIEYISIDRATRYSNPNHVCNHKCLIRAEDLQKRVKIEKAVERYYWK